MEKVDSFFKEIECLYKGEKYSVRDNGAVMRHSREGKRIRKDDNIWSFGKLNTQNGFLIVGGKRVHQIVATAFSGEAPTKQHVVAHIDTDKRNNRPENLSWVTKFESTVLTPYNCEKIKALCNNGIENILMNIAIIQELELTEKFSWIKKIDQYEASKAYENIMEIADLSNQNVFNSLDEWLDDRYELHNRVFNDNSDKKSYIKQSLTPNAIQIK